jgi:hypothetical protein
MTTLESRYDARLREFAAARESVHERRARAEAIRDPVLRARELAEVSRIASGEDEIEFLLNAAPFIREHDTVTTVPPEEDHADAAPKKKNAFGKFAKVTHATNKNQTLQRYLVEVEKDASALVPSMYYTKRPLDRDAVCDAPGDDGSVCNSNMVFSARESVMICQNCGNTRDFMEMTDANMSYEQEVSQDVISYFAYKRLNHFTEWLNSLQAKENTEIPEAVMDAVKAEFKKARATTRADITAKRVREFLKKLKLNRYYEHTNSLVNALNGVPPPKLSEELEQRFKKMFALIQAPFDKHCPKNRKNFLSYSYTLYKFAELLGEDHLLVHFPLLKSAEKLHAQDMIWRDICRELQWQFIRSV